MRALPSHGWSSCETHRHRDQEATADTLHRSSLNSSDWSDLAFGKLGPSDHLRPHVGEAGLPAADWGAAACPAGAAALQTVWHFHPQLP